MIPVLVAKFVKNLRSVIAPTKAIKSDAVLLYNRIGHDHPFKLQPDKNMLSVTNWLIQSFRPYIYRPLRVGVRESD